LRTPVKAIPIPSLTRAPPGLLQRKCACGRTASPHGECEACRKKSESGTFQRGGDYSSSFKPHPSEVPPSVYDVLRSSGEPLDANTRSFFEPRFGHDFSQVRVHTDARASDSARAVDALAYTLGRDIVFAHGHFTPRTVSGQRLLAHELAHMIQQSVAAPQVVPGDLRVGQPNDPLEHEAEKISTSLLSARVGVEKPFGASGRGEGQPILRRQPKPAQQTDPLRTMPPKEERDVTTRTPAQPVCQPPSNIPIPCRPKPLSNGEFLKTGAPDKAFGVTIIEKGATITPPAVLTKPAGKDKGVRLQQTKATPVPCQSFYTKTGHFSRKVSIDPNDPKEASLAGLCGSSYVGKFNLVKEGEKKVIDAEMEHCRDYKHAFDISLGCYANVVNDIAQKKTIFTSHEDAVDAVTKRVGRKPDTWTEHYLGLLDKSAVRDTNKWHTAIWQGPGVGVERKGGRCEAASEAEINKQSYPQVNKHGTPKVIF
jgi:hypothetical protein